MSTFSSILSSIGGPNKATQPTSNGTVANTARPVLKKADTSAGTTTRAPISPAAGVKRKSEDPEHHPRPKAARIEGIQPPKTADAQATSNRFQLSGKQAGRAQPVAAPARSSSSPAVPTKARLPSSKPPVQRDAAPTTNNAAPPAKKGFASVMERAKAAQEAAKAAGSSTIKHKPVEKLTKRDRQRIMEAAKAEQAAAKRRTVQTGSHGKSGRPPQEAASKGQEVGYKGTMRKPPEPLAYKGTMRNEAAGDKNSKKRKGEAQDKYGGYASWSDLDDAEEEDEEDYDSEGSSEMEGGFDDLEREELIATRAARKEDQEQMEEEERHRREKLARKRKLMELNASAKARKKY